MRSLAYQSDRIGWRHAGEVRERDDGWVVRTPAEPTYRWGNLILFREAPGPGDRERWERRFDEEFRDLPEVRHRAFGWDDPEGAPGEAQAFTTHGYAFERNRVLVAERVLTPARPLLELEARALASDADWAGALVCELACAADDPPSASHARFVAQRLAVARALTEDGHGRWFGGFLRGRLVASLGLLVEDGLGRFQNVGTRPEWRGRGACGTLLHAAGREAEETLGVRRLVLVAEPGSPAEHVYRAQGFEPTEHQASLCRPADAGPAS